MNLKPSENIKIYGMENFFHELSGLYKQKKLERNQDRRRCINWIKFNNITYKNNQWLRYWGRQCSNKKLQY